MEQFKVKNLKSFKNSGAIDIKPLTIFLGKNSCGKSSLVRVFPLIKQTFEKSASEPILWYSDYVDYGDFNNALIKNTDHKEISFMFKVKANDKYKYYLDRIEGIEKYKIEFSLNEKNITYFNIKYTNVDIKLYFSNDKVNVNINGQDMGVKKWKYSFKQYSFIPTLFENEKEYIYYLYGAPYMQMKKLSAEINELIKKYNIEIKKEEAKKIIESLGKNVKYSKIKSNVLELLKYKTTNLSDENINVIINNIILCYLPTILYYVSSSLKDEFIGFKYIKPLRATAARFYRVQGINVNDVDSNGDNVPMILHNMKKSDKSKFNDWCIENFGIQIESKSIGAHTSIMIKDINNNYETNLADAGFGYSQILPIIMSLWLVEHKKEESVTYVIEQPELHLHPKMQKEIIDVISRIASKSNNIKFIIETHSESIVNEIGRLIRRQKLSYEDVNVVIVNKENGYSNVKQTNYDSEGLIEEWPIGFFS